MQQHENNARVRPDLALKGSMEAEAALANIRLRCAGAARIIVAHCKPCKCSGQWQQSYLWHNYRPLERKMEEIILSLVKDMREAPTIVVTATASILRFVENESVPLCKDQFLRMISVAVCLNAKFWDDEQAGIMQNERIATAHSIPLDEFNMMEIAFMRGLHWNLHVSEDEFAAWVEELEAGGEDRKLVALRRNPSPHSSTDMVDGIERMLADYRTGAPETTAFPRIGSGLTA
mmetsp:Transcript_13753/g.27150  ORF Transcript_13753/g.27150 Transcript_13753/m.27150 type:complete len:233 (+) Transcript_13753:180-878(+)